MMDRWKDKLSEFLDGTLEEREAVELESHLQSCLDCRRALEELREVVAHARALPDVEPASDLWPSLSARLASTAQVDLASLQVIALPARRQTKAPRRLSFTMPQLAAAALALMLLSGGVVWFVLGANVPGQPGQTARVRQTRLVTDVATDYAAAVQSLETALQQQRNRLDPSTVAVLEENLRTIDAAIAEARTALQSDPGNLYLNLHLESTMKKKVQLLRRATALRSVGS
jgi:putative zinc finger protein